MSFQGWQEAALEFFEGLERENTKAYWTAHRSVYDQAVLEPMTQLTDELAAEYGPAKIFRPYRDIRFSADKSPYRTEIGAIVGSAYIRLSAAGLSAGNGMFHLAADQLDRYRRSVADDATGAELAEITKSLASQGMMLISHEKLKAAPRGYPADHARADLLKNKGLVAYREWPVEPWLGTPEAGHRVKEFLLASSPLTRWLDAHVGAPTA